MAKRNSNGASGKGPRQAQQSMIDLEQVRKDTPATAQVLHFNNAGAGLMPLPVVRTLHEHIDLEASIGGYEAAAQAETRLAAVYESLARLVGSAPQEIAVIENATLAWDAAFYAMKFQAGDRILTGQCEYAANYVAYLQTAKRTGAVVDTIPNNDLGETDPEALEAMMDERVKLISLTHIPTNGGLVNPAAEIGRIAQAHGVPFLLDACQAVGQMPIDVDRLGCDMLSATGRKFLRGPRGTGFLYIRRNLLERLEPHMIDHFAAPWVAPGGYKLRDDARRFETWENNIAAKLGLGVAVDYALSLGLEAIQARAWALAARLRESLADTAGVTVYDVGANPCAIVTFAVEGVEASAIKQSLQAQRMNINVSRGSSTLLDALARELPPLLRASPHYYNTEEEVGRFVEAVGRIAATGSS